MEDVVIILRLAGYVSDDEFDVERGYGSYRVEIDVNRFKYAIRHYEDRLVCRYRLYKCSGMQCYIYGEYDEAEGLLEGVSMIM